MDTAHPRHLLTEAGNGLSLPALKDGHARRMTGLPRYLLAATLGAVLATKELERREILHCSCPPECWCHIPGASLLRWILPVGHACCDEPG